MTKQFSIVLAVAFLLMTSHRCPGPIIEESTPAATATPAKAKPTPPPSTPQPSEKSQREASLSDFVTEKPEEPSEPKQKRSKKSKPERTATVTKPVPALSAAPVASRGFAGTWKGTLTDGADWTIVINPTETAATVRSSLGSTGGPTRVEGGALWWNCKPPGRSSLAKQNVPWSMRLMGNRRAEVSAHQASGNNFGVVEKVD